MTTNDRNQDAPLTPSGEQFEISHGEQHATVVEVGGGVRRYRVGERDLLDGYAQDRRCTGARGLPLIPWPNRIQDGAYTFDGVDYQVPLTEPERHNAIHGFGRWRNWTCRRRTGNSVQMGIVLHPQMGYPFALDVAVDYRLGEQGLTVTTRAVNIGTEPCPYGTGQHPYLTLGTDVIDPCGSTMDARRWLPTDDRGLPTGYAAVENRAMTFAWTTNRQPRHRLHVHRSCSRRRRSGVGIVGAPDGATVALWVDEAYPFIEIYTAHTQPDPHCRTGLGVEPMTCAPNAFRSGNGLIRLAPGETSVASWGLHIN